MVNSIFPGVVFPVASHTQLKEELVFPFKMRYDTLLGQLTIKVKAYATLSSIRHGSTHLQPFSANKLATMDLDTPLMHMHHMLQTMCFRYLK